MICLYVYINIYLYVYQQFMQRHLDFQKQFLPYNIAVLLTSVRRINVRL